uniref:hypothetical protein n=1 Tax=Prevotella sp. TaxID=59823 RepID=UPI0040278B4E
MLKKKMLNLAADMVAQWRIYGKANGKSSDTIYDQRGRVVGHDSSSVDLPKGVYIVNGKKKIVK